MKKYLIILFACLTVWQVGAQTLLNKSFDTNSINHLLISNFIGPVEISSTTGDKIIVKTSYVNKERDDKLSIEYKIIDDALTVYFKSPCTKDETSFTFDPKKPFKSIRTKNNCTWHKDEEMDLPSIKIEVLLPSNINVYASTILGGDITISEVRSEIRARNVNGSIHLDNVEEVSEATTINGEVVVNYHTNPKVSGTFKTINGDIELSMPSSPDFEAKFKCFNGDLYTDIDGLKVLEDSIDKKSSANGKSIKIDGVTMVSAGNGGRVLNLETFNGNGYLKTK